MNEKKHANPGMDTLRSTNSTPTHMMTNKLSKMLLLLVCSTVLACASVAQESQSPAGPSVARQWTDALLFAIRRDLARPTVHARNLYHLSAAMFDTWALYDSDVTTLFSTATSDHPDCRNAFAFRAEAASLSAQEKAVSRNQAVGMAAWTLLNHRFKDNRSSPLLLQQFQQVAQAQGLQNPEPPVQNEFSAINAGASVGRCVIAEGLADGSNQQNDYANRGYAPVNTPLDPTVPGNPGLNDPNRWQPLQLSIFIDQSGNRTDTPEFLGADWGLVTPFALRSNDRTNITIDNETITVWMDPGPPPYIANDPDANQIYQRNHAMVALWSAHLDPASEQTIDISPGSIGNLPALSTFANDHESILAEYDNIDGGLRRNRGHATNPFTSEPYVANVVPLGDYARVLAEFWADGPDSETPPGHWFGIYNEAVVGHAQHDRKLAGLGSELDALSYDVIVYLALGGALHDSAIAAWSTKRAYDYVRPITAIRYMASLGQSSDINVPNYHVHGVPLVPGRIETIQAGDALAGSDGENIGKIKAFAWLGPDAIYDPSRETAGVGWMLLEKWWPYQRPTFVTPPFAGYVSGHSTFSRAAAEVLTATTGDEFFPGGMAEFIAPRNDFLVFEQGPSVDVRLQWATYRDAADQTSLSRIWGGIHPPADDLVGRKMGAEIGAQAWLRVASMVDDAYPEVELAPPSLDSETSDEFNVTSSLASSGSGCSVSATGDDSSMLLLCLLAIAGYLGRRFPSKNTRWKNGNNPG